MRASRLLPLPLLVAATVVASFGADRRSDWAALSALDPGHRIRVFPHSGNRIDGRFLGYSDDAVRLETRGGMTSLGRDDIWRISRQGRRKTLPGALIGAGAGVVVLLIWVIRDEYEDDVVYPVVGAVLGAGIGALFRGYEDIYRVPRDPARSPPAN